MLVGGAIALSLGVALGPAWPSSLPGDADLSSQFATRPPSGLLSLGLLLILTAPAVRVAGLALGLVRRRCWAAALLIALTLLGWLAYLLGGMER